MKISLNCLNELIDLHDISTLELSEQLTLAGFEVESITAISMIQDTIIELSVTANRQDIIGIINIAVEISALLKKPLKMQASFYSNRKNIIKINNFNCPNSLRKIKKLIVMTIKNACLYFPHNYSKNYLKAYDIRHTDSILDIIKLTNIKWGQSIKIYQIPRNQQPSLESAVIFTIKESEDNYSDIDMYWNYKKIIEINESNIKYLDKTQSIDILIINDIYKTYCNHKDRKLISLDTYCLDAYENLLHSINKIYPHTELNTKIYEYNTEDKNKHIIQCQIQKIHNILGPTIQNRQTVYIDTLTIINILKNLNFQVIQKNDTLNVIIPKERINDITEDIDIIEEIGRIYGFNKVQNTLPTFYRTGSISSTHYLHQKVSQILRGLGLHEVVSYSLQKLTNDKTVQIVNPLNQEQKILRNNIINSLVTSKIYNKNQTNEIFEAFEIGKIFVPKLYNQQQLETIHLGGILGNNTFNQLTWHSIKKPLSWFQAKGQLEELFEKINADISWSQHCNNKYYIEFFKKYIHPKRTIYLEHKQKTIGLFSQLNNQFTTSMNLSYQIYFFEINLHGLNKSLKTNKHLSYIYRPYSQYPKVVRDISIKIRSSISIQNLKNIINILVKKHTNYLDSIQVIAEYRNTKFTKTISLRTTYRAQNKTFTSQEIEILDKILKRDLNFALEKDDE